MNISFVMGVYNNLHLTKKSYECLRKVYPEAHLVISSGGSTDGTKEWLENLDDDNLSYFHDDERLTFSDTYNNGIKLVDTEKLVLIHNDMIIGEHFLENLDKKIEKDTLITYTTVEPPIFASHIRPGKIIKNFGFDFDDFDQKSFDEFVEKNKNNNTVDVGAAFFMSGYKELFEDVGLFDGYSFVPAFCEDDDFIIRTKLKGYKLLTISNAIVYHFVSKTSRFSEDYKEHKEKYEFNSNINFIRKWGIPISIFNQLRYWDDDNFNYPIFSMGLHSDYPDDIIKVEPFFDKIKTNNIPETQLKEKQKDTNYDLRSKFTFPDDVDVFVTQHSQFTNEDLMVLYKLRLSIPYYEPGKYRIGNMTILINKKIKGSE